MYYENKRSFYIKQYGPVAVVVVILIALIATGIMVGFNYMNGNNNVVAEVPEEKVENKVENKAEEVKPEVVVDTNSYTLTKEAITGKVTSVNGTVITVKSENSTYDINLIGIMENDKNPELSKTISNNLKDKTVTVDFGNVKTENGKIYGYIYLDNTLYNKTLLAKGLAELRPERTNIEKLDILVAAQIEARHNGLGIWAY